MRYVNVMMTARYLEWVEQMETVRRLQGAELARGSLILVVQRGDEGTDSWGDLPDVGPKWGKWDGSDGEDEDEDDQTLHPRPKKLKFGRQQGSGAQTGSPKQPSAASSPNQEGSFQHAWKVFKETQQRRSSQPRSFVFTKSEEETDDEEMVEVPREYFEKLEIGSGRKVVAAEQVVTEDKREREERAADRQFFEAQG